jgi:hypothetical protein
MVKRLTQLQKLALRFGEGDMLEGGMPEGGMPEGGMPEGGGLVDNEPVVALPDVQVGGNPICNTSIPDINNHVGSLGHDEETARVLGGVGKNRYHDLSYDKLKDIATQYMTQLNNCDITSELFKTLADPLKDILEMLCYYNSTKRFFGFPDARSSSNPNDDHVAHNTDWNNLRQGVVSGAFKTKITSNQDQLKDLGLLQKYNESVKLLETPYCQDTGECYDNANPPAAVAAPEALPGVEQGVQQGAEPAAPVLDEVQEQVPPPAEPAPQAEPGVQQEAEPGVQQEAEPAPQAEPENLQARVEALQRELEQANTANAAQVEQLNQAAELLNQRITSLQEEKNQLQEQLNAAGAGDPQIEPLQQQIAEAEAAMTTAQQQLAEVQAQYDNERQASLQQFETAQNAVTQFIQRSRDNLAAALARIEGMNQLLQGGQATAFGFVLAYGKKQSSVPNRNLYYGRQYPTMPNMFGKDFLDDGFSDDYSTDDSGDDSGDE